MKFYIKHRGKPSQNGDYEVDIRGAWRHFPDRSWAKSNIAHFVGWVAVDAPGGMIRLEDGRRWSLRPENHDAILATLGFAKWIGVKFGSNVE